MFRILLTTSDSWTLALMRLVLGVVFFAHGAQKMLGWYGGRGYTPAMEHFCPLKPSPHVPHWQTGSQDAPLAS